MFGPGGIHPARTSTPARVAVQGELTDDEHLGSDGGGGEVHHTVVVVEDPQSGDLVGELDRPRAAVVVGHTDEHTQPGSDRPDALEYRRWTGPARHLRPQDPLDESTHEPSVPRSHPYSADVPRDLLLTASDTTRHVRAHIALDAGARLERVVVGVGDRDVDLLAPTPTEDREPWSTGWGSFSMAPWAGRIRHGRFRFLDDVLGLDLNHDDGCGVGGGGGPIEPPDPPLVGDPHVDPDGDRRHAIHGTTFSRPWTIVESEADRCLLTCPLTGALGWPYAGTATQRIALHADRLELELTVAADHGTAFPASIGWHPWFAKPDRVDFGPVAMYALDPIGLPTGELVTPTAGPWDDCFVNHDPVRLVYDRPVVPEVTVTSDCDHWVVYDEPVDATCVEPQSGPPDAPSIRPDIVTSGRPIHRRMTIAW